MFHLWLLSSMYLWFFNGFQGISGQISITLDTWTSKAYDPYLVVTAHYIDTSPEQPNEWTLCSNLLGFTEIKGNHSGVNQAATVLCIIDRYDICDKACLIDCTFAHGYDLLTNISSLDGQHQTIQHQMIEHAKFSSMFLIITLKVVSGRLINIVHSMYILYYIWFSF